MEGERSAGRQVAYPHYLNLLARETFQYHLLSFSLESKKVIIHRRQWPPADTPEAKSSAKPIYDHYPAPYTNFPVLELHVHPYFVIVNTGLKFDKHSASTADDAVAALVSKIYKSWVLRDPPEQWSKDAAEPIPVSADTANLGRLCTSYSPTDISPLMGPKQCPEFDAASSDTM
ncbi:hypothetical protein BV22DRAFT_1033716 [Leucogyrophana mollusca]|uniref:Uncharacterized protein n=1 Tax=Leucogyrophana mollusca TaxID=85980 RepID=A0ACB8BM93_9AGAM|nr:hypothetical protein BV22DRAFT_1033716 [Leucogyrophana mollusca]